MKNIASIAIGLLIILAVVLTAYWFWTPEVGSVGSLDEFNDLPAMYCTLDDKSVSGLYGTMYLNGGKMRADYTIEGQGVASSFHTTVQNGVAYTWADNIPYNESSPFVLGSNSIEAGLLAVAKCERIWNLDEETFALPVDRPFHERGKPLPTEYDEQGNLLPEEVAPTE